MEAKDRTLIYNGLAETLASIHSVNIDQPGMASGVICRTIFHSIIDSLFGFFSALTDYGKHTGFFARQVKTWTMQSQASIAAPPGKHSSGVAYESDAWKRPLRDAALSHERNV